MIHSEVRTFRRRVLGNLAVGVQRRLSLAQALISRVAFSRLHLGL